MGIFVKKKKKKKKKNTQHSGERFRTIGPLVDLVVLWDSYIDRT